MEERERLTFQRPGAPGDPASIVVMTTVQVVDAHGVQVAAGTGRSVVAIAPGTEHRELTDWAQAAADEALLLGGPEPADVAEDVVNDAALLSLTKAGLQAVLDERGIEYSKSATKDQLQALLV